MEFLHHQCLSMGSDRSFAEHLSLELQRSKDRDPERSSPCDWIVFSNVSETVFERDFEEGLI